MSMYLLGSATERSNGRVGGLRKWNRAPSLEEAIAIAKAGPAESDRGASVVPVYESDFSAGVGGSTGELRASVTGNETIGGEGGWLKCTVTADGSASVAIGGVGSFPNNQYRTNKSRLKIGYKVYLPSTNAAGSGFFVGPSSTATGRVYNINPVVAGFSSGLKIEATDQVVTVLAETTGIISDGAIHNAIIGWLIGGVTGDVFYVKEVFGAVLGNTVDLAPSSIQLAPGQWLDSANGKHWHIPDGFRLGRPRTTGQLRGVNTWDNDVTPQPLNGADLNCIPADAEVTIRAKVGAGSHDFDIGDGVDGDRYAAAVTIGTDWTPIPLDKIASASDGTYRKIVFKPTTAFDGTLTTSVRVVKLE